MASWERRGIRFWQDEWLGEGKLKDRFPNIYSIAYEREIQVENVHESDAGGEGWTVRVKRNLKDWEVEQYCNLLLFLTNIKLMENGDRRMVTAEYGNLTRRKASW